MKKIIRKVDHVRGLVQITCADERWYLKNVGEPTEKAVPSVTWIAGKYPKGVQFYKWLADKGWDESQAIKVAAGDKGSKVHDAISDIIAGFEVRIDSQYLNRSNGKMEELTLEECECLRSFVAWRDAVKPKFIVWDTTVFHDRIGYAGTIDAIAEIDGVVYIIDFKTSQDVWAEYELQVSAYLQALKDDPANYTGPNIDWTKAKLAILQVGYRRNKAGFKWNEIEDAMRFFLAAREIWEKEHGGEKPNKREYPIVLAAGKKKEEVAESPVLSSDGAEVINL